MGLYPGLAFSLVCQCPISGQERKVTPNTYRYQLHLQHNLYKGLPDSKESRKCPLDQTFQGFPPAPTLSIWTDRPSYNYNYPAWTVSPGSHCPDLSCNLRVQRHMTSCAPLMAMESVRIKSLCFIKRSLHYFWGDCNTTCIDFC